MSERDKKKKKRLGVFNSTLQRIHRLGVQGAAASPVHDGDHITDQSGNYITDQSGNRWIVG